MRTGSDIQQITQARKGPLYAAEANFVKGALGTVTARITANSIAVDRIINAVEVVIARAQLAV